MQVDHFLVEHPVPIHARKEGRKEGRKKERKEEKKRKKEKVKLERTIKD
jgi:hypothetical protein